MSVFISKCHQNMVASIPDQFREEFNRIQEIDGELRVTDIRLIPTPSDEQMDYYIQLFAEAEKLACTFDIAGVESIIGMTPLLRNFISNMLNIVKAQRVVATYMWHKRLMERQLLLDFIR